MVKKLLFSGLLVGLFLALAGCGSSSPVERLKQELSQYPEFSIILEDMKEEGNFFSNYYHRYKTVYAQKEGDSLVYISDITDWLKVSEKEYRKYEPFLGMVLVSKTPDGKIADVQYPPGYQYVGNPQYGRWQNDSRGNSFWEFYGKYALMSQLFGMFNRPVYRSDWNDYRRYRSERRPFFGRNKQYGTYGSATKQTNKSFFERRLAKERLRKQSFREKLKQRTRRSRMSGARQRSGGFGK